MCLDRDIYNFIATARFDSAPQVYEVIISFKYLLVLVTSFKQMGRSLFPLFVAAILSHGKSGEVGLHPKSPLEYFSTTQKGFFF